MNNIVSENGAYDIIISIKPIYSDMILNKKKKYEFRKHGFTKPIDKAFIYSTKPIGKIVGYFTVDKVFKILLLEFGPNVMILQVFLKIILSNIMRVPRLPTQSR